MAAAASAVAVDAAVVVVAVAGEAVVADVPAAARALAAVGVRVPGAALAPEVGRVPPQVLGIWGAAAIAPGAIVRKVAPAPT